MAQTLTKITPAGAAPVKLDEIVGYEPVKRTHAPITLENELAYLGAHVGADDKLRDREGKEIYIHLQAPSGPYPPQGVLELQARELEELRKKFTVVILPRHAIVP